MEDKPEPYELSYFGSLERLNKAAMEEVLERRLENLKRVKASDKTIENYTRKLRHFKETGELIGARRNPEIFTAPRKPTGRPKKIREPKVERLETRFEPIIDSVDDYSPEFTVEDM